MERHSSFEFLHLSMWLILILFTPHARGSTSYDGHLTLESSSDHYTNFTESLDWRLDLVNGHLNASSESLKQTTLDPINGHSEGTNLAESLEDRKPDQGNGISNFTKNLQQLKKELENGDSISDLEGVDNSEIDGSLTDLNSNENNQVPTSLDFLQSYEESMNGSEIIWPDPIIEDISNDTLLLLKRRRDVPRRGFTDEEKDTLLRLHNLYRGNMTPPAGDMGFLEWDTQLEYTSQVWADGCEFTHGRPENASYPDMYGQNLYLGEDASAEYGMWLWFIEYEDYDLKTKKCQPHKDCGHYVNLAWATTQKVGCGMRKCGLRYYTVCHYWPAAITATQAYRVGRPCSQCPSKEGSLCYHNLCMTWEQCERNPKLCDDAECKLKCRNCGRLNRTTCKCDCPDGWDSPDCSRLCGNEHPRCKLSPGFPNTKTCFMSNSIVANQYCRKMCHTCNAYEKEAKSENVCCDGKLCEVGHILDIETCTCKMLCPGLKCDYMDPESSGDTLRNYLTTTIFIMVVTRFVFYSQFVIIK